MKKLLSLCAVCLLSTPLEAAPIYPTYGASFIVNDAGVARTSSGRLDALVTFDTPLDGVLTFSHWNEDDWPIDSNDGIDRWAKRSDKGIGTPLDFVEFSIQVDGLLFLGFARFVNPSAAPIYVKNFDYVSSRPVTLPSNPTQPAPIPEPSTMLLIGTGLYGIWKRRLS